jgi:hypothetical protein
LHYAPQEREVDLSIAIAAVDEPARIATGPDVVDSTLEVVAKLAGHARTRPGADEIRPPPAM